MADVEPEGAETPGGKGKPPESPAKKKHHDNIVIIIVSIVGVFLTYLIYRRSTSSSSSSSSQLPAGYGNGQVAGAGASSDPNLGALADQLNQANQANQAAFAGFQGYLSQLDQELQTLSNQVSNPAAPAMPSSSFYDARQANFFVATQADENILKSRGISISQMFRVFDPFASRGGDYAAPTDLQSAPAGTQGIYFGAGQQDAPGGAPVLGGPDRVTTTTELDQLLGFKPGKYAAQGAVPTSGPAATVPIHGNPIILGRGLPAPVPGGVVQPGG